MAGLEDAVKLFKKAGAWCRKIRGRNTYVCWKDGVKATITDEKIVVRVPGELRSEYLSLRTVDGWSEEALMKTLEELTGASKAYIDVPDTLELVLEYSVDRADKAVKAMDKIARNDLWVAATNLHGELRLYRTGRWVETSEWLEALG